MEKINLNGIKTLVFDLGGVIVTLDRDEAVRRFTAAGAHDAAQSLNAYRQSGIFLELEAGNISPKAFCDLFRRETGSTAPDADINAGWLGFMKDVPLAKLRLLEDLRRRGYRLLLLSNTNAVIMDWALSPSFSPEGKPLDAYFDRLYLSYRLGCLKPDPLIFRKMINHSCLKPEETLFVDDGDANVSIARQLGFHTFQPANGEDFTPRFYP
jgi:putative hydrolase of the HAD superfamily